MKIAYIVQHLPDVSGPDCQECDIYLPPVCLTLVGQVIQNQGYVMVAVVCYDIMVSLAKYLIGFVNGLVPLICCVLIVIQYQVLERCTKCQLPRVHGSSAHKIKDGAIRCTNTCVADAWKTASDAGQSSPNHAVGVPVMSRVDCHIHFKLRLHLLLFHILYNLVYKYPI